MIARADLHFWEEPCISGRNGSGTVFFSGCSLNCVYCQNYEISHKNKGKVISVERLAEIFRELEQKGAENINLVNPTHYVRAIKSALDIYKPKIPIVYNSSGYESDESLEIAMNFADIFLLDLKYLTPERAKRYSNAADYPDRAKKTILKVSRSIANRFDTKGMMMSGLIVRHLILPQGTNEAMMVIKWLEDNISDAVLSIMSQYTPCGDLDVFPELQRKITKREYKKVLDFAEDSKIETIFTQEMKSADESYIPSFDYKGV